jgi:hypothetical protein
VLTQLSPAQGTVGTTVTLYGQNFGSTAGSVSFSGATAALLSWSDTQIQAQVPNGASSGAVYVQNGQGTSNGLNFTVVSADPTPAPAPAPAPQATFVYPASGNPGSRVVIYGHGFGQSAGQVLFNGVPGQVAYWYDTLIGVTVPAGATSGALVVHTSGGDANALQFVVNGGDPAATQPQLSYVSPAAGAVGSQVSVLGQNLGDTPGSVTFNGVAAGILNWTASAVVVIVPQGASSGQVQVQTGGGTSNGVSFTVIQQPQPAPAPQPAPQPTPQPAGGGSSNGSGSSNGRGYPRHRRHSGYLAPSSPYGWTNPPTTVPTPAPAPQPTPAPSGGGIVFGNTGTGAGAGSGIPLGSTDGSPVAFSVAPTVVQSGGQFTIQGSNFGSNPGWVRLGRAAARVVSWSDTSIVAEVPAGFTILGRISVRVVRPDYRYTEALYLQLSP